MNINHVLNHVPSIQNSNYLSNESAQTKGKQVQEDPTVTKAIKKEISKKDVSQAVEAWNGFMETSLRSVRFEFHEDLEEYYVKVVDPLTNEVLREIPPKKMLDMHATMLSYMGILVDKKV